jgi:ApaG protein
LALVIVYYSDVMNAPKQQHDIRVTVEVMYSPGHSRAGAYFYIYFIRIENLGSLTAQLLRRHWFIRDATGHTQEVEGEGVIGEQPILEPGGSFQYNSGVPIASPPGKMHGYYVFKDELGTEFKAEVPGFELLQPTELASTPDSRPSVKRIVN